MGQKVNPIGFRLAVNKDWRSKWYATGQDYATKLHEDLVMRKYIKEQLMSARACAALPPRSTLTLWKSVPLKRTPSLLQKTWPSSWNAAFPSAAP